MRDLIPQQAIAVLTVDLAALHNNELGTRLLKLARVVAGLPDGERLCGADPLQGVDSIAFAIPQEGIDAGFGVFATGRVDATQLVGCAQRVIAARGGKPIRQQRDGFQVVFDGSNKLSNVRLAVRPGGPVVVAEQSYLAAALAVARGSVAPVQDDGRHQELLELVHQGPLVATVVLTAKQRKTLIDGLRLRSLSTPFSAVGSGAFSLRLDTALTLHAVLLCDQPANCVELAGVVEAYRREEASSVTAKLIGLSPLLERLSVRTLKRSLHLELRLSLDETLALLARAKRLRQLAESPAATRPPPPSPAPSLPASVGRQVRPRLDASAGAPSVSPTAAPSAVPAGSAIPR